MPHVDFLGVGDFGVSTRADTVFPPRVAHVVWKRGRAYREQDHILLYLLLLTGSSSTSSASRCPARVTFETGPLLHGHVLRSAALWWGGGEAASHV